MTRRRVNDRRARPSWRETLLVGGTLGYVLAAAAAYLYWR